MARVICRQLSKFSKYKERPHNREVFTLCRFLNLTPSIFVLNYFYASQTSQ